MFSPFLMPRPTATTTSASWMPCSSSLAHEVHPLHAAGQQFRRRPSRDRSRPCGRTAVRPAGSSAAAPSPSADGGWGLDRGQDVAADGRAGLQQVARLRLDVQHRAVGGQAGVGLDRDVGHERAAGGGRAGDDDLRAMLARSPSACRPRTARRGSAPAAGASTASTRSAPRSISSCRSPASISWPKMRAVSSVAALVGQLALASATRG